MSPKSLVSGKNPHTSLTYLARQLIYELQIQKTRLTGNLEVILRASPQFLWPIRLVMIFIKRLSFRSRRKKSEANPTREVDFLAIFRQNIALPCATHTIGIQWKSSCVQPENRLPGSDLLQIFSYGSGKTVS